MAERTLVNPPNEVSRVTVGCTCSVCDGEPFTAGIGEYRREDLNGMFKALIGEATSPAVAAQKNLSPTRAKHEQEAFALASVIFNRAAHDKALIADGKPARWGYNSDGTPLGVVERSQVVAYTEGTYRTYLEQARQLGWLVSGSDYCQWLEILKAQIERAARNPGSRDAYVGWRSHRASRRGAVNILNTDFLMTP